MKIDEVDRRILSILSDNSRLSLRQLAKMVGYSPMGIYKRLKKLESMGVIKKYSVITDPASIGYACSFYILVRVSPGHDVDKVAEEINSMDGINMVNVIAGQYDLIVLTKCLERGVAITLLKKIRSIKGVSRVTPFYIIKTV